MLSIESISKSYGDVTVNDNISFNIKQGARFGLLGPNGAGKTTLIRMLTQIIYPDKGQFTLNGKAIGSNDARLFGYMPEERGLYKQMKVYEHLMYLARLKGLSKHEAKTAVLDWFDRFAIHDWKNKKLEALSKGMQQKVQFIATVCHKPKIIIRDEPFSGLDPVNTQVIRREIERLNSEGATIIFSTHRMEQVEELCEHIALINKGKLVMFGKVKNIKQRFKENAFKLTTEKPIALSTYRLFGEISCLENNTYIFNLYDNKSGNQLLKTLLSDNHTIIHFEELLPSLNEVFLKQVEEPKLALNAPNA